MLAAFQDSAKQRTHISSVPGLEETEGISKDGSPPRGRPMTGSAFESWSAGRLHPSVNSASKHTKYRAPKAARSSTKPIPSMGKLVAKELRGRAPRAFPMHRVQVRRHDLILLLISLFTSLHFASLRFTSLHFASLRFTSLHFASLRFTSLHFASLRFTSLHFASLHFTSLHFASLRFALPR